MLSGQGGELADRVPADLPSGVGKTPASLDHLFHTKPIPEEAANDLAPPGLIGPESGGIFHRRPNHNHRLFRGPPPLDRRRFTVSRDPLLHAQFRGTAGFVPGIEIGETLEGIKETRSCPRRQAMCNGVSPCSGHPLRHPVPGEPDRARVWIIARAVQEGVAIAGGRVDASGSFDNSRNSAIRLVVATRKTRLRSAASCRDSVCMVSVGTSQFVRADCGVPDRCCVCLT